jgi:hypothetical protein
MNRNIIAVAVSVGSKSYPQLPSIPGGATLKCMNECNKGGSTFEEAAGGYVDCLLKSVLKSKVEGLMRKEALRWLLGKA